MHRLSLVVTGAIALGACSTAVSEPQTRSARAETQLQQLLAGKVAGPPVSCLPNHRGNEMVVIDDNTLLFRQSGSLVYRAELEGSCSRLGSGFYALKTNRFGGGGLCRGEIAEVVDVQNGFSVGSCAFGDFVPYRSGR
ncbi:MAG TPA: hypothetical protein VM265_00810 [Sphingomicrobium sp.]|nr:hypothetical protein [Sphingomicrobium sp.]